MGETIGVYLRNEDREILSRLCPDAPTIQAAIMEMMRIGCLVVEKEKREELENGCGEETENGN